MPVARAGIGRGLPAEDRRPPVLQMLQRAVRGDRAEARRAVPVAFAGRGSFVARTKDEAALSSAIVKDDGIERGLDALVAEAERVSRFGFTRDRARPPEAGRAAQLRAAGRREGQPRLGQPRRRVHPQLPRRARRCRPPTTSTRCTSASCRPITLDEVNKLAKEWFTDAQSPRHRHARPRSRGSSCRTRRSWRPGDHGRGGEGR